MMSSPSPINHRPSSPRPSNRPRNDDRKDGEDARRREHQPRMIRVVAKEVFQQCRQLRARAVENRVGKEDDDARAGKVAVEQHAEIHNRPRLLQLPINQAAQPQHKERDEDLDAPERIAQPIPLLPLAQEHFPRDDHNDEQAEPDVIEAENLFLQRSQFLLEILRIVDDRRAEKEGGDANRDVDIKNPAPRILIGEIAAQRGPDNRRQQRGETEGGPGPCLVFRAGMYPAKCPGCTVASLRPRGPAGRGKRSVRPDSSPGHRAAMTP